MVRAPAGVIRLFGSRITPEKPYGVDGLGEPRHCRAILDDSVIGKPRAASVTVVAAANRRRQDGRFRA